MEIPEFGIKRDNEERRDGGCAIIYDPVKERYAIGKHVQDGFLRLFSGGVDSSEDIKTGILREVYEESGLYDFEYVEKIGEAFCHYHNSLKNVNRVAHATCFLIILKSVKLKPTKLEEHEKFVLDWVSSDELKENWNLDRFKYDCEHWLYFLEIAMKRISDEGY